MPTKFQNEQFFEILLRKYETRKIEFQSSYDVGESCGKKNRLLPPHRVRPGRRLDATDKTHDANTAVTETTTADTVSGTAFAKVSYFPSSVISAA
ncbi:Hypothetical protein CINCED_3A015656 [Cinara cedri]|uniref:Uncharacterized protein n=1 Tax=Cinara cedri TaxID=506608 RepID=A0A5E4ND37_9HEMI|nr:Hypothetical protein CINCED_3A015656 [Cinara cedri]